MGTPRLSAFFMMSNMAFFRLYSEIFDTRSRKRLPFEVSTQIFSSSDKPSVIKSNFVIPSFSFTSLSIWVLLRSRPVIPIFTSRKTSLRFFLYRILVSFASTISQQHSVSPALLCQFFHLSHAAAIWFWYFPHHTGFGLNDPFRMLCKNSSLCSNSYNERSSRGLSKLFALPTILLILHIV